MELKKEKELLELSLSESLLQAATSPAPAPRPSDSPVPGEIDGATMATGSPFGMGSQVRTLSLLTVGAPVLKRLHFLLPVDSC